YLHNDSLGQRAGGARCALHGGGGRQVQGSKPMTLYSERQWLLGAAPDVLVYDKFESPGRVKVNYAIEDLLGGPRNYIGGWETTKERYRFVADGLRRLYGLPRLSQSIHEDDCEDDLKGFVLREQNCARILDVVELVIRVARYFRERLHHRLDPD